MNLPTSETTPDGFDSLPPNRRRRIKLVIKNASDTEIHNYLNNLLGQTQPDLDYLIFLLFSAFLVFLAFKLNSPLLLFVAALAAPCLKPLAGALLSPSLPSAGVFLRSAAGLLGTGLVTFASGWLAGTPSPTALGADRIPMPELAQSGWLEWSLLLLGAVIFAWRFLRENTPPRLISAILTLLVIFPLAVAGWLWHTQDGSGALAVILLTAARLTAVLLVGMLTAWFAGLLPRHASGWVIFGLILTMTVLAFSGLNAQRTHLPQQSDLLDTRGSESQSTPTAPPQPSPSETALVAKPISKPTETPLPTKAPSATPNQTATPIMAWVLSPTGVRVRAEPNANAKVLTYINDGVLIQLLGEQMLTDGTLWEKVIAPDGKVGWIVGQYLLTATPAN